jgi:hypothetical protein
LGGSGNGGDKIKTLIAKLMEEYKKTRNATELSFGMDEDVTKVGDWITLEHVLKKETLCHQDSLIIKSPT